MPCLTVHVNACVCVRARARENEPHMVLRKGNADDFK